MSTREVRFDREIPERRSNDIDDAGVAAKPEDREAFASKLEESQRAPSKDAAKDDDRGPPTASKRRARRSGDDAATALIAPSHEPPPKPIARPEGGLDLVSAIDEVMIAEAGREASAPIDGATPGVGGDPPGAAPTIAPVALDACAALAFASILPAIAPPPSASAPVPSPRPSTEIVGARTNLGEARDAPVPWAVDRAERIVDPPGPAPVEASIEPRDAAPVIARASLIAGAPSSARASFEPREASPAIARPQASRSARLDADASRAITPLDVKAHGASASPRIDARAEAPPPARVDRSDAPRAQRPSIAGEPLSPAMIQAVAIAEQGPAAAGVQAVIEGASDAPVEENPSDVAPADPRAAHDGSPRLREGVAASKTDAPVLREALSEVPDRHAAAVAVSRLTRERSAHAEVEIPDLGRIAVTARAHAKDVDVALMASAGSVDVLRAAGSELASSLREAKIQLGSLHIGTHAGGGQGPSHNGDGRPDPSRGDGDVAEIAARSGPARRVRFVL